MIERLNSINIFTYFYRGKEKRLKCLKNNILTSIYIDNFKVIPLEYMNNNKVQIESFDKNIMDDIYNEYQQYKEKIKRLRENKKVYKCWIIYFF